MRFLHSLSAFTLVATFALSASADVITDWNIVAIDAARSFANPNPATRAVAIGHLAAYDAVNAIDKTGKKYLPGELAVTLPASVDSAAIQAFHDALVFAIPAKKADLDKAAEKALKNVPDGAAKTNGIAVGAAAAAAIVTARTADGSGTPVAYAGEDALGKWRPTPPANAVANTPEWATLKPFLLTAPTQFDPGAPPALTSAKYAADLTETQSYGAKTGSLRTADQTSIAQFWAQQTHLPFYQLARTFSKSQELTVDENARFFGQLSLALADSRVAVWSAKYAYGLWRPVTSINSPLDDGNAATTPDPEGDWASLLDSPNHPEYVSGHSATGAAGATILAAWFGDDNSFAVTSETLVGAAYTRSFTSFSDAAQENADSRIYGGIHYRFSNEAGLELGEKVADYVLANALGAFPVDPGAGGAGGADSGAGGADSNAGGEPAEAGAGPTPTAGTGGTTSGGTGGSATGGTATAGEPPVGEAGEPAAEGGAPASGGSGPGPAPAGDSDDDSGCSVSHGSSGGAASLLLAALGLASLIRRRR